MTEPDFCSSNEMNPLDRDLVSETGQSEERGLADSLLIVYLLHVDFVCLAAFGCLRKAACVSKDDERPR